MRAGGGAMSTATASSATIGTDAILALWKHIYGDGQGRQCLFSGKRLTPETQKLEQVEQLFVSYPEDLQHAAKTLLQRSEQGRETYACAHLLTKDERSKAAAAFVSTLYADLDGARVPSDLPQPTALIESSPGRQQGYWKLSRPLPPAEAEALNQRLTRDIGADLSGYDLTQLLRMPGTVNHKRAERFVVRLVHLDDERAIDPDELDRLLTPLPPPITPRPLPHVSPTRPAAAGDALLSKALESDPLLRRLFDGDICNYPSSSQADEAFCCKAIWWANHDRTLVDDWLRRSRLSRDKWDEVHYADGSTYGQKTIERADAFVPDGYRPPLRFGFNLSDAQQAETPLGGDTPRDSDPSMPPSTPPPAPPVAPADAPHPADNLLTDLGNAQRLVNRHGEDLRYVADFKKWLEWNGHHWDIDETEAVMRRAKLTVRAMYAEATAIADDDRAAKLVKHALASQSATRLEAMVKLARSESAIPVRQSQLDANPWLLSAANGTIDLRTGALRAHRRADLITKAVSVTYDPDATCPRWLAFLDRIMGGDAELVDFLQRAIGYCLTGSTDERAFFLLHGGGTNGKTSFLESIAMLLGDLGLRTPVETLLVKRHEGIGNDIARLRGARFVYTSESEEGKRLAESLIKDLTGGDTLSARFLYAEPFEFAPTFKIWLATNHKPVIRGTDNAIWNRVRLIPFNVIIPPAERVAKETLLARHRAELPGILAWAVRGCLAWQRDGSLVAPEAVQAATAGYRQEMDTIAAFLDEECVVNRMATVAASELYTAYTRWAKASEEATPLSQRAFGTRLREHGDFTPGKGTGGVRFWHGLRLIEDRTAFRTTGEGFQSETIRADPGTQDRAKGGS